MKHSLFISMLLISISAFTQVAPNKYYLEFTDKNNNGYSLDNPEEFLSERSLQRRANQGIDLDYSDLPVAQIYVDSLESLGLEVLNVSKWFNSVTVFTTDTALIDSIMYLSFVSNSAKMSPQLSERKETPQKYRKPKIAKLDNSKLNYYDYGPSANQIFMHNGQKLHNEGFRGQGMLIAVTDAGFTGLPNLPAFDSLFEDNRVLATRNFAKGGNEVYDYSTHGMRVLSIISGNYPGNLIGSAPEASFLLLMSEDPNSETFVEEINWVSAAEFADSMGADVINVSLGYVQFDTPEFNHSYTQLNGRTAIISQAATIASRKGMIVVASAANSGTSETHPWIAAPGDADSIITAGAVWSDQTYASFSSIGPSADGRVKPDVVAMGGGTTNQNLDGTIGTGDGTSFSSPILSGLIACLWQKFPNKTNMEIIEAVRQSSSIYNTPTVYLGYGIPDFDYASLILESENTYVRESQIAIFPNPFSTDFVIRLTNKTGDEIQVSITDINGRKTYLWMEQVAREDNIKISIEDLANFQPGVYIISVNINNSKFSEKLIKR